MHQYKIRKLLPQDKLQGRAAMENVNGKTLDISEYCDFDFYNLVWYHLGLHPNFNGENRTLGQWLDVSHGIGSDMCYWILTR